MEIQHQMSDDEKVEALRHVTDMASAMESLAELCEMVSGDERRAKEVMPLIIEVARSTAERANAVRMLISN